MDVLAVERGDEAPVEGLDDAADDLVTGMLLVLDLVAPRREAVEAGDHVEKLAGGAAEDARRLVEHVVKLLFARDETETHGSESPATN